MKTVLTALWLSLLFTYTQGWILCGCDVFVRDSLQSVSDCFNRLRGLCDTNSLRWRLEGSNQPDEPWPHSGVWYYRNESLLDAACVETPVVGSGVRVEWMQSDDTVTVTLEEGILNGTRVGWVWCGFCLCFVDHLFEWKECDGVFEANECWVDVFARCEVSSVAAHV